MADIFDPLDITGFSDEDIAFLDLYMAAYLLREPFGILFRGQRHDYDDFQGAIRNPRWPHTLTPFGMEKELIVRSMDRLGSVFEQFCKETPIHGVKRKLDPFPMIANGFAECKATQLRRLERAEEILRLQEENRELRNGNSVLSTIATADSSKLKNVAKQLEEKNTTIGEKDSTIAILAERIRVMEEANEKNSTEKEQKKDKTDRKRFTISNVPPYLALLLAIIGAWKEVNKRDDLIAQLTIKLEQKEAPEKALEAKRASEYAYTPSQTSLLDSSSTSSPFPYPKDTEPHVNHKQPTFKEGK